MSSFVMAATITIRPNGNGNYNSWTNVGCSSADEWDCVNEVTANTSDYLYTTSTSAKETFSFEDSSLTSATINSITLYYNAKRYGTKNYYIRPLIRVSSTDYFGSVKTLTSSYATYSETFLTNPATGSAWSLSDIVSLEAGMNTYTTRPGGYVSQVYAIVDYTNVDTCSDSDSGNNPFTFGTTSGYFNQIFYSTDDFCTDSSTITEFYCSGTTKVNATSSCGTDSYGSNFCYLNNVYRNLTDYSCGSGACSSSVTSELVETCTYGCNISSCIQRPDLIIDSINFNEYLVSANGTNYTYANVTTTVKNAGLAIASPSYTRLVELSSGNWYTGALAAGASYKINRQYVCSSAHNYTAIADYTSIVNETNEANNGYSNVYIDCII